MAEENEELAGELDKLVKRNVGLEEELIKLGVRPNPSVLYNVRLNMLLDRIYADNEEGRLGFEIEFQNHVHAILMSIHQQTLEDRTKAKLLLPNASVL